MYTCRKAQAVITAHRTTGRPAQKRGVPVSYTVSSDATLHRAEEINLVNMPVTPVRARLLLRLSSLLQLLTPTLHRMRFGYTSIRVKLAAVTAAYAAFKSSMAVVSGPLALAWLVAGGVIVRGLGRVCLAARMGRVQSCSGTGLKQHYGFVWWLLQTR